MENEEERSDMLEELIDRFGEPPKSVENLLYIARTKSMAHAVYLTEIVQKGDTIKFTLYERAKIDVVKIPQLVASYGSNVKFTADSKTPYFTYFLKKNSREKNVTVSEVIEKFLKDMQMLLLTQM